MATATATPDRAAILSGLRRFIAQRSGVELRNYISGPGDADGRRAFMAEYRRILRDGRDARRMLEWVDGRDRITAEDIASRARGGRLELSGDRREWHYTAGQYFAVEYRAAAARLLAGIIWDYLADGYPAGYPAGSADDIRRRARLIFGRGIAGRYFA
ncbi:MAG: hypothetical protein EBR82_59470 [Caulobacteraceae bacterium]|nr:hypothetical protein [Caulobacteraceae bacterium]